MKDEKSKKKVGRPNLGKVYKTVSICASPVELEKLKKLAEKEKKTLSRLILDKILYGKKEKEKEGRIKNI